jgi:crotonobetainyl-CoA:carnitine CoA-transferase CaiB-like acyl-CoA transferase
MSASAFDGLRVLDLSWGTAGPMTTMFLVDNGAEVTRISPPGGDPFAGQAGYRVWNRGKRSAELDLRDGCDREVFLRLAAAADVVVESFSPGTTARLGIDHATLSATNPGLVTCSITGYGRGTRHADRPGYDVLVAARTGLLFDQKGRSGTAMEHIAGRPGPLPELGPPEGLVRGADRPGPVMPRTPWPSVGATYLAALGIAAALRAREVTGVGQWVETSLLQGALAAVCLNWQRVENPDAPLYWMWPTDGRSIDGLYECADGRWVHHWTVRPHWVLTAADGDELCPPPLETTYRDDPDRLSMDPEGMLACSFLHPMLAEAFAKFPSTAWVAAAAECGMGIAPVRSPAEALTDESLLADGCVVTVDDPEVGPIRHVGPLLDLSATPGAVRGPAPRPGQHTGEVRSEAVLARPAPAPSAKSALGSALDGIRVLDLGLGIAGPFTGRVLADLGADVVKVNARHDGDWNGTHMGLGTNRGKRSIAVDLKDPQGRAVLDRLLEGADVVTTNWRPGVACRLGLDFETLHIRFPRLIWCSTRGYERGPRSHLPGTAQTAAALTGADWEDGGCDAGNPPLWSRANMGDTGNAFLAAIAITTALYHRERTGEGQAVSTSIVNAGLLHTSYAWVHDDGTPSDWGHVDREQHGLSPYYRLYRCAHDTWLAVAAMTDEQRQALHALGEDLEAAFAARDAADWFRRLDGAGVPVEVVDEDFCRTLFDDPDARANGLISSTSSVAVGRFEDPGLLVSLSATPAVVPRGPCACGEHTRELLVETGYTADEIDALLAAGAVC